MKNILITIALILTLPLLAAAQRITASPLEGRWTWNEKGEEEPEFTELVFFGNVILCSYETPEYEGSDFTLAGRTISFYDGDVVWQYQISGRNLTITDEYNDRFTYVKAAMTRSPLEGIWKFEDEDIFFIFTGDILAVGEESEYDGMKIAFNGRKFHPTFEWFELNGEDRASFEKSLRENSVEYNRTGETLSIKDGNEDIILKKVY